jgi:hypothetical protein
MLRSASTLHLSFINVYICDIKSSTPLSRLIKKQDVVSVHWNNLFSLLTTWFFLLIYEILYYIGDYNYLIYWMFVGLQFTCINYIYTCIVIVFALCKMLHSASTLHLSFINVFICDIKSSTPLSRLIKKQDVVSSNVL